MDIFVARQPVFTEKKKVFGYELLFRLGLENVFPTIDGDTATSKLLTNTFFSFELNELLAGKPGLVNFTRNLILQKTPLLFPKEHIIIEVLENIEPEPEVIKSLEEFQKNGFRIALDDFIYHKKFLPMIALCSIIKFDIIATPLDTLGPVFKAIESQHPISLLAEKVETYQEFEKAREMGFHLFQGYFFSKPEILSKKDVSSAQITKLNLTNEFGHPQLDLPKIEGLIKKDLSVSFKLLKFINSAYFKRPTPINTIKDAMTFLGTDELKKFIHLAVISDLSENKPNELIRSSVIRARMCELCGGMLKTHFTMEELFTIGMFSYLDAILDRPMKDILVNLNFSDKIKEALLKKDKQYNQLSILVTSFEKGEWDNGLYKLMDGRKIIEKLPEFYLDAIQMADSFFI
ncbi:MAG: signal transduction protein [Desulfobacteraceae bacterium 4572_89]|nr:MAG: signal transduction protein [Desulfobacteraceae bacterium 4572_89]